jgi:protocatechuate 3,4-dioxygenase beta subunit
MMAVSLHRRNDGIRGRRQRDQSQTSNRTSGSCGRRCDAGLRRRDKDQCYHHNHRYHCIKYFMYGDSRRRRGSLFRGRSATGFARSDIRSNLEGSNSQSGIPLTLSIYAYDSENSCAAMANVQIDIWQCNGSGIYSAEDVEDTSGETWLRGYQITDANGLATFKTIVRGWYAGRTTHIHLRLRSTYDSTTTGGRNTTQLFFPQDVIDTINTTISPYSAEGTNPTTNASDHVYSGEVDGVNLHTLSGDNTNDYTATCKINLPITALSKARATEIQAAGLVPGGSIARNSSAKRRL